MQASKIRPDKIYAIRYRTPGQDEIAKMPLVRFTVTAVVTRRFRNTGSPHDFDSTIEGYIDPDDVTKFSIPAERAGSQVPSGPKIVLSPDGILGPYQEFVELQARQDAEQQAVKRKNEQLEAGKLEAMRLLYVLTGLPFPNDPKSHNNAFRAGYGLNIEITHTGIEALLATLRDSLQVPKGGSNEISGNDPDR